MILNVIVGDESGGQRLQGAFGPELAGGAGRHEGIGGFVRVDVTTKDGSGQAGSWMMRAKDVVGLTPTQIASKFGLPQVPTMITDVTIPPGTTMNVSAANGISPWDARGHYTGGNGGGGGVQFQVTTKVTSPKEFESWFNNARPLK